MAAGRGQPDRDDGAGAVSRRHISLDALNFFLADANGALGPYLNVFLVTQLGWSRFLAGQVTTISGLIGLVAQTPVGMAIDATRAKRAVVLIALAVLAVGATVIFAAPSYWPILIANSAIAVTGGVFGPAVAILTLGLFSRQERARRMGRNSAFDHAGNITIALIAGAVGWLFGQRAVFLLAPFFAVLAACAVLSLPRASIDLTQERLREARMDRAGEQRPDEHEHGRAHIPWRPLAALAVCAMLFHFANAPLLPLVGQKLALANRAWATPLMSLCIVAAQLVMLPVALLAGRKADQWGRKPVLLLGFAVLCARAALYTVSDNSVWLIAVQLLDGIGAGIWGVLLPLVVADLMAGTGRYNSALGMILTAQGIGASFSGLALGWIVDHAGYNTAFTVAACIAALALTVLYCTLPETLDRAALGKA